MLSYTIEANSSNQFLYWSLYLPMCHANYKEISHMSNHKEIKTKQKNYAEKAPKNDRKK